MLNRSENYASADSFECPSVNATDVRLLKQRALNPFRNDSSSCQDIPIYVFPKSCQIFQGVVADMTTMADYAFLGMKSSESNFDYEVLCRELGVDPNNTSVSGRSFSDVEQTLEFARSHDIGGHWTSAKLQDWLISRQVWSPTQFNSVDFSQSRIGVNKCVFNKHTIKVSVSCC